MDYEALSNLYIERDRLCEILVSLHVEDEAGVEVSEEIEKLDKAIYAIRGIR